MHILVCDDDQIFVQKMVNFLQEQPEGGDMQITACSVPETLTDQQLADFDIMFLDVDMGKISGLDIARRVRKLGLETVLIFVSYYIEYSPDGYEVGAFRYLLKGSIKEKLPLYLKEAIEKVQSHASGLTFTLNGENRHIKCSRILYLESQGRLVYLHSADGEKQDCRFYARMEDLENQLREAGFLRVHKSYLVNMRYIEALNYNKLQLATGKELPVSQRRYADLKTKHLIWKSKQ